MRSMPPPFAVRAPTAARSAVLCPLGGPSGFFFRAKAIEPSRQCVYNFLALCLMGSGRFQRQIRKFKKPGVHRIEK